MCRLSTVLCAFGQGGWGVWGGRGGGPQQARLIHGLCGMTEFDHRRPVHIKGAPKGACHPGDTRLGPSHAGAADRGTHHQVQVARRACQPTELEARLLSMAADEPCLVVVRRTFTREAPITIARLVHPGSRWRLSGEFSP